MNVKFLCVVMAPGDRTNEKGKSRISDRNHARSDEMEAGSSLDPPPPLLCL